jgi:type I restriction enzyme, R subunit
VRVLGHFASGMIRTANFGFLAAHDSNLVTLGGQAERYFRDDPPTCLVKLRQLAELITRGLAGGKAAGDPLVWV